MTNLKCKIIDSAGLHARPASIIVSVASKFNSEIKIIHNSKNGNLKSIMNVMALGVKKNEEIEIQADGSDEKEAISEIKKALKENNLT